MVHFVDFVKANYNKKAVKDELNRNPGKEVEFLLPTGKKIQVSRNESGLLKMDYPELSKPEIAYVRVIQFWLQ